MAKSRVFLLRHDASLPPAVWRVSQTLFIQKYLRLSNISMRTAGAKTPANGERNKMSAVFTHFLPQKCTLPSTLWATRNSPLAHFVLTTGYLFQPFLVNGKVVGYMKPVKNLRHLALRDAGHMAPRNIPAEALDMFERFISGKMFDDTIVP